MKIENAPYDEAVNLSDGSEIPSVDENKPQNSETDYQDRRNLNSVEIKAGYYNP